MSGGRGGVVITEEAASLDGGRCGVGGDGVTYQGTEARSRKPSVLTRVRRDDCG